MVNMQSGSVLQRSKRDSGMELLKIFGMLMIIFGHIIRTLRLKSAAVPYSDYVIDTAAATESVRVLMLHIMSYSGQFGNWMFFFCSAWFLVDSKESRKNKITFMVMDLAGVGDYSCRFSHRQPRYCLEQSNYAEPFSRQFRLTTGI
ncbi:MAG: hypothetical protein IK063_00335 [Clostridia bacterium]|nr:hypothetical protein [Clostridia bacterium]